MNKNNVGCRHYFKLIKNVCHWTITVLVHLNRHLFHLFLMNYFLRLFTSFLNRCPLRTRAKLWRKRLTIFATKDLLKDYSCRRWGFIFEQQWYKVKFWRHQKRTWKSLRQHEVTFCENIKQVRKPNRLNVW